MNMKLRSLLAAVIALSLAVPGLAAADRRDHDRHHDYRYDRHHDRGYKHGHGKHHRDRHVYRGDRHITHHYQYDDDGDDLLIGLVVGGVLGYALNSAQHSSTYDYGERYYPPAQSSAYPSGESAYSYGPAGGTCLQEREYQTTVVVGGKNVPAYGTACLQPDGSWKREPAQLVSY
jgi:hypothetical protein